MADDRVEQEIKKQNRSWWETMLDNLDQFRTWLKYVVDTYKMGSDVLASTQRYVDLIKRLLRR
ncbi:MAG: hypothetical protein F6K62_20485 [Sphaerospermopsis sp. SIO1G2]|nr:hypothetical protein [Sphaerospermopsis sp. SIO1G2]